MLLSVSEKQRGLEKKDNLKKTFAKKFLKLGETIYRSKK